MPALDVLRAKQDDFDFFTAEIGDITPSWTDSKRSDGVPVRKIDTINFANNDYKVGDRFTVSLCSKFGIGPSIFSIFDPGEVFERLQFAHPRTRVRIVTDKDKCLAATTPSKSYVHFDTLLSILSRSKRINNIVNCYYNDGMVTTIHRMNEAPWEISGEMFLQAFTMETPVDGYGLPAIYLSLIRESNGTMLTAESKTFKSEIQLGREGDRAEIPLTRVLDTFNNEEGFQALRQRLESARVSLASLHETNSLFKILTRVVSTKNNVDTDIMGAYLQLTGDVVSKYHIASEESISSKKSRLLPMECTILDLIYFCMETITNHRESIKDHNAITRWIGQIIDNEYDLEGELVEDE